MYIYIYIYIYMCVCVCVCICMCVFVYMYVLIFINAFVYIYCIETPICIIVSQFSMVICVPTYFIDSIVPLFSLCKKPVKSVNNWAS